LRELLLRVEHVLERHPVRRQARFKGCVIELENRTIVHPDGGREVPPARDFDLLQLLVNSSPAYTEQHLVANGASELFKEVFGERGRHAGA